MITKCHSTPTTSYQFDLVRFLHWTKIETHNC